MRYLLDTNILIQLVEEPDTISKNTKNILEDTDSLFYVSAVSIQEIFMLMRDSKLNIQYWQKPTDVFKYIENVFYLTVKYVRKEHLLTFADIIPEKGHNDPFDRMIIAQAITEQITLISSDTKFHHYRKQKLEFVFNDK